MADGDAASLPALPIPPRLTPRMTEPETTPPTSSTRGRMGCLVMVLLMLASGGWWWHKRNELLQATPPERSLSKRGPAGAPIPVATEDVKQEDFEEWLNLAGTVTPLNVVTVRSRVDGELQKVHFTEGQQVKAGDLIAEIDPRPFQIQYDQAKGQLARDQALYENSKADLARFQALL